MSYRSSITALKAASLILIGFGLLMFTAVFTPTMVILDHFIDVVFLPHDGGQAVTTETGRLLTGITGGVLVGWGATVWLLTTRVYAFDPTAGKRIILPGALAWFIVDSMGSIAAGAWFNAIVNLLFLLMFAVPILWRTGEANTRTA